MTNVRDAFLQTRRRLSENPANRVDDRERGIASTEFAKVGLDGNGRFQSVGSALSAADSVLTPLGLTVAGLISLSDVEAQVMANKPLYLTVYRVTGEYSDGQPVLEEVTNSSLVLSLYNVAARESDRDLYPFISPVSSDLPGASWEAVAYLS